jgi:hypothetical protein
MYLETDEKCVERLIADQEIAVFTRLPVEGVAAGAASGWYGTSAPYRSSMIMTFLDEGAAGRLLAAVNACREVEDPQHPIHAMQLDVERTAVCDCATRPQGDTE